MKIIETAEGLTLKVSETELVIISEDLLTTYIDNKNHGIKSPLRKSILKTIDDYFESPF